jgi:hypothetical protein
MNISKKALMSFLMALTSLVAMAQPYYHVMKQDGSNQTEEAIYDSKDYKIRVDMVPAEEKPKDAIGGKITIVRYDCDKSCLKRSFYFTKHGNVIYDNTEKKFYFESGQMDRIGWYGVYIDKMFGPISNDIYQHFKWGKTIDQCIGTRNISASVSSEEDFYFTNPKNLPKLQEDLGNERWGVLSACEWEYVIEALSEGICVCTSDICCRCLVIDSTPAKSLIKELQKKAHNYPFLTWEEYCEYARKGLVFLPASGSRGTKGKIDNSGEAGRYWSCTPVDSNKSWCMGFGMSYKTVYESNNGAGYCVRLVILAD